MTRRQTTRQALVVLTLLLAFLVAALGGEAFRRKAASFQPAGFDATRQGAGWLITSVAYPETGLQPGDQLLTAGGQTPADRRQLTSAVTAQASTSLLVLRDDALTELTYSRPPLQLDITYLILALVGTLYLGVGLYTLFRSRQAYGRLFYLWSLASCAVFLLTYTGGGSPDALDRTIYFAEEIARLLLPALTIHFFLLFPRPLGRDRTRQHLTSYLYVPSLVLALLQADLILAEGRWFFGGRIAPALSTLDRLELFLLAAGWSAAAVLFVVRLRGQDAWDERRQLQWIGLGLVAGFSPLVLLYLVPFFLGIQWPESVNAVAVAPLAVVPLSFAWAILRYRLWDLGLIARSTVSYTVTALLGIFGYSLIQLGLTRALPEAWNGAQSFLAFSAGLMVAGLMIPTQKSVRTGIDRLHYRSFYRKRRDLLDFGRDLLQIRNLDRLKSELLNHLEESLDLETVELRLLEDGDDSSLPADMAPEHIWRQDVTHLADSRPVTHAEAALFGEGYRYVFPLEVQTRRLGLLLVGYRRLSLPLDSDELKLIRALLNQATLAIENARLLSALENRLDEVVRLKKHHEGIVEASPAGIAVIDGGGLVVSTNPAFDALVKSRGCSRILQRPIHELVPVTPLPVPGGETLETGFCDLDGRKEHHLQISTAVHSGSEARLQVLIVHDVSDRVLMQHALRERERLAALGMLAAGVAHEVNTPLTGISSYAQMLLQETPSEDPRHDMLRKVERQTFRASRIVNNLLQMARRGDGFSLDVDLVQVLDESVELLVDQVRKKSIHCQWEPPSGRVAVRGSADELQQVFTNLLLNAFQAVPENGKVALALTVEEEWVLVSVADNGPGISPEAKDSIFEPFYSTKLAQGGTGLGLAITRQIVKRHRGEIGLEVPPGGGTRFVVRLPRDREVETPEASS